MRNNTAATSTVPNKEIAPWTVARFFVEFSHVLPACS